MQINKTKKGRAGYLTRFAEGVYNKDVSRCKEQNSF